MPKPTSIRLFVYSAVAAGFIAGMAHFFFMFRQMDREFHEWVDACPLNAVVDFSRPGSYTLPFHQTCQAAHGEAFYLTVAASSDKDITSLLSGLAGTITIYDQDGNEIQTLEISSKIDSDADGLTTLMVAYFQPFPKGEYRATLDIATGAPLLTGIKQRMQAKYLLCGLERFPALIYACLTIVCGIPGLVFSIFAIAGISRRDRSPVDAVGP